MDKPTLPTITAGTAGALATGTYTFRATALDAFGAESLVSATSANKSVTGPTGSVAWSAATESNGVPQTGAAYKIYRTVSGATVYYTVTAAQWRAGFTETGSNSGGVDSTGTATTAVPATTEGLAKYAVISDQSMRALSTATVAGLQTANSAAGVHESELNYIRQLNNMISKVNTMYNDAPTNSTLVLTDAEVSTAKGASAGTQFTNLRGQVTEDANSSANVPATDDAGEQSQTA